MPTNRNIFKAYDIRGIYGTALDEDTAYRLGFAYKKLREQDGLPRRQAGQTGPLQIVVAMDARTSSAGLKEALVRGLTESGLDVVDIGLASTPTFYFAVANFGYDGGIMVSASHNPAQYNGFKMTRQKATPISGETGIEFIRDQIVENKFTKADQSGSVETKTDVLTAQIEHDFKFVDVSKIKPLKVAVDTANGMGVQYIEAMFAKLPCELIPMYFELDGRFPNHEADPLKEENMQDLQKKVLEEKADIGISTDGDGDRIFFVDDEGKTIEQSIIRGILAKIFLREKPGAKIAYDIRPGRITRDMIEENGGIPIVTRVGHSLIKEQALKEGAYFAGESSGHFFLNMDIGCFEVPVIVALKLLEEFSQSDQKVSEYIKPLQRYFHSGEINSEADKDAVFPKLEEKYKDAEINKMDGITVTYPDFWFNVRGSNTEPKLRLNLEARTQELMQQKRDEVLAIIRA
jgi:phosphomannomutase